MEATWWWPTVSEEQVGDDQGHYHVGCVMEATLQDKVDLRALLQDRRQSHQRLNPDPPPSRLPGADQQDPGALEEAEGEDCYEIGVPTVHHVAAEARCRVHKEEVREGVLLRVPLHGG